MKAREAHVVPLPRCCLAIVRRARSLNPNSELLFPGSRTGKELRFADRATAHGFRSSFRNWATEVAKAREVVAEADSAC
jgi:integrase